jgi:multiple sugar transport system substrate-binding protein
MGTRDSQKLGGDRLTRRRFLGAGAAAAGGFYLAACGGGSSSSDGGGSGAGGSGGGGTVTLNNLFMQQAGYSPKDLAGMTAKFEQSYPHIRVKNTLVAYDSLHDKIVAAAPAGTYDVVLGDCIWPAEFATHNIVMDITDKVNSLPVGQIFPGAINMAKYNGKYYGQPWLLDTKYLFVNGKLLKQAGVSPDDFQTLDGMVAALRKIKAKGAVKYPWMGSWARAEAVVCDYAQFLGAFGGRFLDDQGKPAFNTGGGVQALEFMTMLLKDGLANPSSTSALEADVLKAFQQGQVAANLNWTFQLAGAEDPSQSKVANDDVTILHTPKGTAPVAPSCNGGQPLMITTGSKHPDEAWTYIKFISSQPVQNSFVKDSLPIWSSSYDNPAVIKSAGKQLVDVAKTQLPDMILRPQVANYNAASKALQVAIQTALLGRKSPQAALNDAAKAFSSTIP